MPRRSEASGGGGTGSGGRALPNVRLMAWGLAFLRVFVGVKFLWAAMTKWGWLGTPRLAETLTGWAQKSAWEPYERFLTQTAIPHAGTLTYLVFFGEICVGVLLILGLLTRVAALLGILMNANFMLATWHLGAASQGVNQAFLAMQLVFLLVGAGRVYGMDARLARRRPGWLLW